MVKILETLWMDTREVKSPCVCVPAVYRNNDDTEDIRIDSFELLNIVGILPFPEAFERFVCLKKRGFNLGRSHGVSNPRFRFCKMNTVSGQRRNIGVQGL
jgi:hypothetical protein